LYPSHDWHPGLFTKPPNYLWEDLLENLQLGANPSDLPDKPPTEVVRSYIQHLEKRLDIRQPSDWYRISRKQLLKSGGIYMIDKLGGLGQVLPIAYPHFEWELTKFTDKSKKARQRALAVLKEAL